MEHGRSFQPAQHFRGSQFEKRPARGADCQHDYRDEQPQNQPPPVRPCHLAQGLRGQTNSHRHELEEQNRQADRQIGRERMPIRTPKG